METWDRKISLKLTEIRSHTVTSRNVLFKAGGYRTSLEFLREDVLDET